MWQHQLREMLSPLLPSEAVDWLQMAVHTAVWCAVHLAVQRVVRQMHPLAVQIGMGLCAA